MQKGNDQKFVHYGIRKEDLALIEAICEKHEIDKQLYEKYGLEQSEIDFIESKIKPME